MILDPDDAFPISPIEHEAQLAFLEDHLETIANPSALELGAGLGRVAIPLADYAAITAIDSVAKYKDALSAQLQPPSTALQSDFLEKSFDPSTLPGAPYDLITCLGNTLSLITNPLQTLTLFQKCAQALKPAGLLVVDDTPATAWAEIAEGNWQAGTADTDEGPVQLCWHQTEPIIAFRWYDKVDPHTDQVKQDDTLLRLYSPSELSLIANQAGLSAPIHQPQNALIIIPKTT